MMKLVVLRIGHRPVRDKRITTHVGLTARALGASGMLLAADDQKIKESIDNVTRAWGGDFFVEIDVNWREAIKQWKAEGGMVVHLTMYGLNLPDVAYEMRNRDLMIIVGAEKVPPAIYDLADLNVAAGSQPHSEVAALALLLDHLQDGRELVRTFEGERREIVPTRKGKRVIEMT
ncbi:MAG: tRNA (cytidine(56)-2'-O)-methyltransferase [Euryarchaeota archaeon]|nr:tRNA (cytidine(56)-2'-O)-methyltransferase [Euryarchaeota archaeon]